MQLHGSSNLHYGAKTLNPIKEEYNVRYFSIQPFRETFGFADTAFESLGEGEIALKKLSNAVLVVFILH